MDPRGPWQQLHRPTLARGPSRAHPQLPAARHTGTSRLKSVYTGTHIEIQIN